MSTDEAKKRIVRLIDEIEALQIAIVREQSSHEFYEDLLRKHEGTRAGDVFRELAQEETAHKEQLVRKVSSLQQDIEELKRTGYRTTR